MKSKQENIEARAVTMQQKRCSRRLDIPMGGIFRRHRIIVGCAAVCGKAAKPHAKKLLTKAPILPWN